MIINIFQGNSVLPAYFIQLYAYQCHEANLKQIKSKSTYAKHLATWSIMPYFVICHNTYAIKF